MNQTIYSAKNISYGSLKLAEEEAKYIREGKKDQIHDTAIRNVLMNKTEAVILINKQYNYKIKEEDIELYNNRYVTKQLLNRETDVIYKMNNKEVYF